MREDIVKKSMLEPLPPQWARCVSQYARHATSLKNLSSKCSGLYWDLYLKPEKLHCSEAISATLNSPIKQLQNIQDTMH
jgi:hypothetical protein